MAEKVRSILDAKEAYDILKRESQQKGANILADSSTTISPSTRTFGSTHKASSQW